MIVFYFILNDNCYKGHYASFNMLNYNILASGLVALASML